MKFKSIALGLSALVIMASTACKKDTEDSPQNNPPPIDSPIPSNLIKVGEAYINGAAARAVVYAERSLFTGYNRLYVAIYDSSDQSRLNDGHFELNTLMSMGMTTHSSPIEQDEEINPSDKLWNPAVVFIMGGTWKVHLHFHNHRNNLEGEGELNLTVANPLIPVMHSFVIAADDSARVFMSLLQPMQPKIGLNAFEIALHRKVSNDSFPAINDYTIEIIPEMVSMGHGSPDNVNPILTDNGHYEGKVNFTMSGDWRVHIKLRKNGILLDESHYFDFAF
ncbi:MAG: FixH family protein [Bacteroidia bacterium]|jgi:hypothetical protein